MIQPSRSSVPGFALLLFFFFVLEGCSSSSGAAALPVIDALDVPTTAAPASGGVYPVTGTITVHDADANVTRLHLHAPPAADPPDSPLPQPTTQGTFQVTLLFEGQSGATIQYQVTVFDANGVESAPVAKSVTLQ